MEKNLLQLIAVRDENEEIVNENGQMIGFKTDVFPIQFKENISDSRKNEIFKQFNDMQELALNKGSIDLELISKVSIVLKNNYQESLKLDKKMSDNEVVRLFTGDNLSSGTISEYISIAKHFYNSKGELDDIRFNIFGLRELYKLSKFDKEQLEEFLTMIKEIPLEENGRLSRKTALQAIKSYIESGVVKLEDTSTVESKKTDNKEKLKQAEKQLETTKEVVKNQGVTIENCLNAFNQIFELAENPKQKLTKDSLLKVLSDNKILDKLLAYNENLANENPYNAENSEKIYHDTDSCR